MAPWPPVRFRLLTTALVTPAPMERVTVPFVFTLPITPVIVTRFIGIPPETVVGPVMVVLAGITSGTGTTTFGILARLIVFSAAVLLALNTLELKLMFPDPWAAANSSASRRLQCASVPAPDFFCAVQLAAEPVSSMFVVTTRIGALAALADFSGSASSVIILITGVRPVVTAAGSVSA